MNLTIKELDREAMNSTDPLVTALNEALRELASEIEDLASDLKAEPEIRQLEYIKRLIGLPNNF